MTTKVEGNHKAEAMALIDSFLIEAARFGVFIAARRGNARGTGSAQDPFNGSAQQGPSVPITIQNGLGPENDPKQAQANTGSISHGLVDGDMVLISGVTGDDQASWNGMFGIYGVSQNSFKYYMKKQVFTPALGNPKCARLTFPIDRLFHEIPGNSPARINLGPGLFQTRGFA